MTRPDQTLQQFETFCRNIRIASKDQGLVPLALWSTQRYIIRELLRGITDDVRDFVILKPRQVGATTVLTVFTLFWHLKHKALQGGYVAHLDTATHLFRDNISEMAAHIDDPRWTYPIRASNRYQLAWSHGARLQYATAGTKENKTLGRSKGLTYLFADEVAYWGGLGGVASLKATLSERHPARLSIWASTANGYNLFHTLWANAQSAITTRAIFSAWWRHELYRTETIPKGDEIFRVYWDGHLNPEEQSWQREITARWGVTLEPAQWAWWRWQLREKNADDLNRMHEDFPTLPEHAFQATGYGFLSGSLMARLRAQMLQAPHATHYRYHFGPFIDASHLLPTHAQLAHLTVWEEPRGGEHYVVSCDPAYGANAESDFSTVTVWRAERTRLVQVAEFSANEVTVSQFAWVICHLAGVYQQPYLMLELTGPGYPVWQEIQRLQAYGTGSAHAPHLQDVMGAVQFYVFRRADAMAGRGFWAWKSTNQTKAWVFHRLKDHLLSDHIVIRSAAMIEELASVRQDKNMFGAQDGAHDDRVITLALAIEAWQENVIPMLAMSPLAHGEQPPPAALPVEERLMQDFFAKIGAR